MFNRIKMVMFLLHVQYAYASGDPSVVLVAGGIFVYQLIVGITLFEMLRKRSHSLRSYLAITYLLLGVILWNQYFQSSKDETIYTYSLIIYPILFFGYVLLSMKKK